MKRQLYKKGFTLVETLIAITILMLAIVGPMSFVGSGIQQSIYAKDQITAFYIAQEGVEIIRSRRDRAALRSSVGTDENWLLWIPDLCKVSSNPNGCGYDIRNSTGSGGAAIDCSTIANCRLYYDTGGLSLATNERGIYHHTSTGNTATPYTRVIRVDETVASQAATVTVTVSWSTGLLTKSLTLQGYLYNQYDNIQ